MNFCPNCAHPLTRYIPDMDNRERDVCEACDIIHYSNPKIIAGVLPIWEGKILLCKRAIPPQVGYWTLPAGFMENEESLQDCALREAQEEAGIELELKSLYYIYNIPAISQVHFIYLAQVRSPNINIGAETLEASFFDLNDINYDTIAFNSVTTLLDKYKKDCSNGHFPLTEFTGTQ